MNYIHERTLPHPDVKIHHRYCPTCAKLFSDRVQTTREHPLKPPGRSERRQPEAGVENRLGFRRPLQKLLLSRCSPPKGACQRTPAMR
jgi:hypothetical protein